MTGPRDFDAYLGRELGTRPSRVTALVADLGAGGRRRRRRRPCGHLAGGGGPRPGALDRLLAPDHGHARLAGFAPDRGGRWVVRCATGWRRPVEPGLDGASAVVTALVTARTAMVSSTLVLVAGFGCLALSGFGWNRELGLLGGLVLLLALVSDLVLGSAGLSLYGRWDDRRRAARAARDRRRADCGAWPAPSTGRPRSTVPN